MFWSDRPPFRTVKFKVALGYAQLFAVSTCFCFAAVYLYQRNHLYNTIDQKLLTFVQEFEYEYLTGDEFAAASVALNFDQVPPDVFDVVGQKIAGWKPLFAAYHGSRNHGHYLLIGTAGNRLQEFIVRWPSLTIGVRELTLVDRAAVMNHKFNSESYGEGINQIFFLLLSENGRVLARSDFRERLLPFFTGQDFAKYRCSRWFATLSGKCAPIRVLNQRLIDGNILVIGYSLMDIQENLSSLVFIFNSMVLLMLLIGSWAGWLLARKFIRGVDRVTCAARKIEAGDFSLRVGHGDEGEEIDNLVDAFNNMTANTEKLLKELKTISDNIAHDLRTPITRIRGKAELAVLNPEDSSELAGDVAEECAEMLTMINTMLEITQTESGIAQDDFDDLDLTVLTAAVLELFSTVAEDKGITLHQELPAQPLSACGNKVKYQRLLANLLEALRWTRHLARLATPLARAAHLRDVAGAAFSLAFVSPAAANGLLSESHQKGEIDGRELMLANLFNSFPAYLVHTPTIFLLTWPVLGWPAVVYVGLTLLAAVGRTGLTIAFSRRLLPAPPQGCLACTAAADGETGWRAAARKAWKRFRRRVPKLVCFTVPVYIIMYLLQRYGLFTAAEEWLAMHMEWLAFLKPQAMGIIVLHLAAELGAALGAAGSVLQTGGLEARDVVLALMVGNILSTPMRAIRHQLPAYAGFYRPALALRLILANQGLRAVSMAVVTLLYWWVAF